MLAQVPLDCAVGDVRETLCLQISTICDEALLNILDTGTDLFLSDPGRTALLLILGAVMVDTILFWIVIVLRDSYVMAGGVPELRGVVGNLCDREVHFVVIHQYSFLFSWCNVGLRQAIRFLTTSHGEKLKPRQTKAPMQEATNTSCLCCQSYLSIHPLGPCLLAVLVAC